MLETRDVASNCFCAMAGQEIEAASGVRAIQPHLQWQRVHLLARRTMMRNAVP
jgi:hypothetical protein